MPRRATVAALGGTFDRIHAGHRALLDAAFRAAREVRIGLTTEAYLAAHPKPLGERIRSYRARRASLVAFLRDRYPRRRFVVLPLGDGVGRSTDPEVRVLVVSRETLEGGRAVNRARRALGRPPAKLVVVPLVLGADRRPISSRRVRAGEIDVDGSLPASADIKGQAGTDRGAPARAKG